MPAATFDPPPFTGEVARSAGGGAFHGQRKPVSKIEGRREPIRAAPFDSRPPSGRPSPAFGGCPMIR
jgi:hypothetical protein